MQLCLPPSAAESSSSGKSDTFKENHHIKLKLNRQLTHFAISNREIKRNLYPVEHLLLAAILALDIGPTLDLKALELLLLSLGELIPVENLFHLLELLHGDLL